MKINNTKVVLLLAMFLVLSTSFRAPQTTFTSITNMNNIHLHSFQKVTLYQGYSYYYNKHVLSSIVPNVIPPSLTTADICSSQISSNITITTVLPSSELKEIAVNNIPALYRPTPPSISPGFHFTIKGKILNLWGLFFALTVFGSGALILPFMALGCFIEDFFDVKKVL